MSMQSLRKFLNFLGTSIQVNSIISLNYLIFWLSEFFCIIPLKLNIFHNLNIQKLTVQLVNFVDKFVISHNWHILEWQISAPFQHSNQANVQRSNAVPTISLPNSKFKLF